MLQEDLDNETWHVLNRLQELLGLEILPWRIDGFDISHLHGQDTYGCCVVFEQGRPSKNLYRRFKIRSLAEGEINDFESMYETVKRRYRHVMDSEEPAPQLALIDGGTGQLEYAVRALDELRYSIPLVALAEREEVLYLPGRSAPLRLGRDDPALQLLQRVRDEVHRYAITTNRNAREKRVRHSRLEDIAGIGRKVTAELLVRFGSVRKICDMSVDELMSVPGIGRKTAEKILAGLRESEA